MAIGDNGKIRMNNFILRKGLRSRWGAGKGMRSLEQHLALDFYR
jgi:hypothetical protein